MSQIELPSGRIIGDNQPPFIIAEVGSNWTTLEDCLNSIVLAKECGADAVKFQLYDFESLYGIHSLEQLESIADGELIPGQLPLDWLPNLKAKADSVGIEFMCSAFSPELIEAVDPYVNIHKVASAELTHVRMLQKLRGLGKPVILSTGASGSGDIKQAAFLLVQPGLTGITGKMEDCPGVPVVLMYCVAAYPARSVDLYQIHTLRELFGTVVGYSDHSIDVETIPVLAQSHGAFVIEKHVNFVEATSPDAPHSLSADEFKRMVFTLRNYKYKSINTPPGMHPKWNAPTKEEQPMILRHNRRLIATQYIAEGATLKEGVNFGIFRSLKDDTHAFSPWVIGKVEMKQAKRGIKVGDGIGPGDV